jgi:phage baseplate assembly protein V
MDYDTDNVFPRNKTGRDSEIRNMFRHGKVVEIVCDKTQTSVRVQYLDKDGLVSKALPVKQFGSRSSSSFWCPKVGDDVSVTMLPNGNEDGFVDGSFYNTGNPPPITDPNTKHTTFSDGSIIEYGEGAPTSGATRAGGSNASQLTLQLVGPVLLNCTTMTITCSGLMNVTAPEADFDTPTFHIKGNLIVDGTINMGGSASGTTLTINGNIQHTGDMHTSGRHTDVNGTHH